MFEVDAYLGLNEKQHSRREYDTTDIKFHFLL